MMNKASSAAAAALLTATSIGLFGCSGPEPHPVKTVISQASYAEGYSSLAELAVASDVIVQGTIIGSKPATAMSGIPFTDATFQVSKWVRGNGKVGQDLTIHQTGGVLDGTVYVTDGDPLFQKGETAMLYLRNAGDGRYFTVAGPTGRLEIKNGVVSKLKGSSISQSIPSSVQDVTFATESALR